MADSFKVYVDYSKVRLKLTNMSEAVRAEFLSQTADSRSTPHSSDSPAPKRPLRPGA